MKTTDKLKKVFESINENDEKAARTLFHDVVVEMARKIYSEMELHEDEEDMDVDMDMDMDMEAGAEDLEDDLIDDMAEIDSEEMDGDAPLDDLASGMADVDEFDDRISNLEDAFEELKKEFEELTMDDEDMEMDADMDDMGDMDMDADMGDMPVDPEMEIKETSSGFEDYFPVQQDDGSWRPEGDMGTMGPKFDSKEKAKAWCDKEHDWQRKYIRDQDAKYGDPRKDDDESFYESKKKVVKESKKPTAKKVK